MSWYQLDSILKESASYVVYYRAQPPTNCPFDGTPLLTGPGTEPYVLYCPDGNFVYPRDWDPDTMSGM